MTYHSSTLLFGEGGLVLALTITKVCPRCSEEKVLTEFHKDKTGKLGACSHCKVCKQQYYVNNRERRGEYDKQWYRDNRVQKLNYKKQWYKNNRTRKLEYDREWSKNNPEKIAAYRAKRRALKMNASGNYTSEEFIELCNTYDNICLRCGADDVNLTADHVVPLSKGGSNDIGNIQPLCLSCNCKKGVNVIDYRHELIAS